MSAGQVEDVAQALAVRLEHDRERAGSARRPRAGPRARLRCAQSGVRRPGSTPRQEQRARRRSRESARRRATVPPSALHDQVLDLVGRGEEELDGRAAPRPPGTRKTMPSSDHIASTSRPRSRRAAAPATAIAHGAWTRAPNGREHADAAIAELVEVALDDDRRDRSAPRRSPRACSRRYASEVRRGALRRGRAPRAAARSASPRLRSRQRRASARRSRAPNSSGRPGAVAVPERHLPGLARGGR